MNQNKKHTWIFILAIILIVIIIYILIPELDGADHSPSSILEQSRDEDYLDDYFEKFR